MKDTHVLCAAVILAILAITVVFVGYATDTLPWHTHRQITRESIQATPGAAQAATTTAKKKGCSCCKENMKKLGEHLEKRRQQKNAAKTTNLAAESGKKEGMP